MYCQKCGSENTEEARFCRDCGHSIIIVPNDAFFSGHEFRFILPAFNNYALSKKSSFRFFIDKVLVKSGYLSDGFDFIYIIMPGRDNYHLLEVIYDQLHFITKTKKFLIKNFMENKDFSQIKGHLIEFTYKNFFYYQLKIRQ